MQRTAIVLACFLNWLTGISQLPRSGGQYPFVQYTPREGLVNNRARFIFQDSKGKLYISTFGGISIYDGTRFTNYNKKNGLGSYMVNDFAEMGDDSIWILPNANKIQCLVKGRLSDFVPADRFTPLVNQLIKCSDGFYYALADEGLFRLENGRFVKVPITGLPPGVVAKTFLNAVEIEKKLFILSNPDYRGNGENLLVYDLSQKHLLGYNHDLHAFFLFNPWGNELWIATATGLFRWEKMGKPGEPVALQPLPDSYHIPKDLVVYFMYKDKQSNLWMTTGKGVCKIKKDGEISWFTMENGLTTNLQTSIFQDRENNMWFTNEQTGLSTLTNKQLAFYPNAAFKERDPPTNIFIQPSSDSVWLYDGNHHRMVLQLPNGQTKEFTNNEPVNAYSKFVSGNEKYLLSVNKIYRWIEIGRA